MELDKEEGYVVLPGYSPVTLKVDLSDEISVTIFRIADRQLSEVGHVVHVPAKDDAAEAEAIFCDGEELLLRDEFTT